MSPKQELTTRERDKIKSDDCLFSPRTYKSTQSQRKFAKPENTNLRTDYQGWLNEFTSRLEARKKRLTNLRTDYQRVAKRIHQSARKAQKAVHFTHIQTCDQLVFVCFVPPPPPKKKRKRKTCVNLRTNLSSNHIRRQQQFETNKN